jgi:hypothetical protein
VWFEGSLKLVLLPPSRAGKLAIALGIPLGIKTIPAGTQQKKLGVARFLTPLRGFEMTARSAGGCMKILNEKYITGVFGRDALCRLSLTLALN